MYKILTIDKNPLECQFMNQLLQKHENINYLGQTSDEKTALEIIERIKPEIIFLGIDNKRKHFSINMIPQIKSISNESHIIISFMQYEFKAVQTALNYGAFDYFIKPLKTDFFDDFLTTIIHSIEKKSQYYLRFKQKNQFNNTIKLIKSCTSQEIDDIATEVCNALLLPHLTDLNAMIIPCKQFALSLFNNFMLDLSDDATCDLLVTSLSEFFSKLNHVDTGGEIWYDLNTYIINNYHIINKSNPDLTIQHIIKAKNLIREYVEKEKPISLDIIAEKMLLSSYYLSHLFQEIDHTTFTDYLLSYRLDKSKLLLSTTNKSIKEIASKCGYDETNSFSRMFKRRTGLSPNEYRKTCS